MTMSYRTLGGTGIEVSTYCLGAMMFGAIGNPGHEDCARIIHAALDQGINFVDTADMYSAGESEEIVGKALTGRRDDVVLATKVHFPMGEGPNDRGLSRKHVREQIDASLRRLQVDYVDLYQCHRYDVATPLEETVQAMDDLVRAGKVLYWGVSEWNADQIAAAVNLARARGWAEPVSNQPQYSAQSPQLSAANSSGLSSSVTSTACSADSNCSGVRGPTMGPVTPGRVSNQASPTAPGSSPSSAQRSS